MIATAIAPANIAFIKYWGMRDHVYTLPYNGSLSMNLDGCLTTTTVAFDGALNDDEVTLTLYGQQPTIATGRPRERVVQHLNRLRSLTREERRARVQSSNNFPADAGIASSAAAFAALTLATTTALGLQLDERTMSRLTRQSGSGSASRSIPQGFVEWYNGDDETSFAASVAPPEHWGLRDVVAVVDMKPKKIGSAENHQLVTTSPYYGVRLSEIESRLQRCRDAILQRDFKMLGTVTEADAISMHVVCMTQTPPSFYWTAGTMAVIHAVRSWREQGLNAYFTMDAGANVHVICTEADSAEVQTQLESLPDVQFTLMNGPGNGARLLIDGTP